jgi:hypothetical protein
MSNAKDAAAPDGDGTARRTFHCKENINPKEGELKDK